MLSKKRTKVACWREAEQEVCPHLPLVVNSVSGQRERRQRDELKEEKCVKQELKEAKTDKKWTERFT